MINALMMDIMSLLDTRRFISCILTFPSSGLIDSSHILLFVDLYYFIAASQSQNAQTQHLKATQFLDKFVLFQTQAVLSRLDALNTLSDFLGTLKY